jgi:hypothetical protein
VAEVMVGGNCGVGVVIMMVGGATKWWLISGKG